MKLSVGLAIFGVLFSSFVLAGDRFEASTPSGLIIGHRSSKRAEVIEYLGIPYAQPPVNELRFAPPRKVSGERVHIASDYVRLENTSLHKLPGSDCLYSASPLVDYPRKTPQFNRIFEDFAAVNNNTQSEDCLTLNIWLKESRSLRQPKPVLIHFYGGRWTSGTSNTPFYYGGYFADAEDVIVVTVNYRMNIFGFPGIPGQPPNPGLLDQRLAVEWVHDNIHAFGGDPSRITISGQSCGSASVDYWAYAYPLEPLVAGLVSHSGTVFSFPVNTPDVAAQHWYNVSKALGCGFSGDVLYCMRNQSANSIKAAAAKVKVPTGNPARKTPAFQPTLDGVTVFDNYSSLSDEGKFARIPYLVGHNDNEAGFYKIAAYAQGFKMADSKWQDFNTDTFNCPTSKEATNRARKNVPTWRFRYYADWDNTRLYPTSGAYHGVDLNMIFTASQDVTGLPESKSQRALQKTMQKAWAAFVSNPTMGLAEIGWPMFDPEGNTLIRLGYENNPMPSFIDPSVYDNQCTAASAGSS